MPATASSIIAGRKHLSVKKIAEYYSRSLNILIQPKTKPYVRAFKNKRI